ncbi:hypothetical protein C8R48DRAFT_769784 [Suillus tomentosus]|nr:hypothetical protein C8R48DRAFT_769784 [Suillus tomentosus]
MSNAPPQRRKSRRSTTKNLPVIRQEGYNIAGNPSTSQLGSASDVPRHIRYDTDSAQIVYQNPDQQHQLAHEHQQHQLTHEHQQHQLAHEHQQYQLTHEHQQHHLPHQHQQHHLPHQQHHLPHQQHQLPHEHQQHQLPHEHLQHQLLHEHQQHHYYGLTYPSTSRTSFPPSFRGEVPAPRRSLLSGDYPRVAGPDRNARSRQAPKFQVAYSLAPMRFQEEEFMDGVVYRVGESGIQRRITREYALPPVRPPRVVGSVSDSSGVSASAAGSTSAPAPSVPAHIPAPAPSVPAHVPVPAPSVTMQIPAPESVVYSPQGAYDAKNAVHKAVAKAASEIVMRDALNKCCLPTTSEKQATARQALLDSCHVSTKDWAVQNLGALYKTVTVPVTDLLSSFGSVARGVVQRAYGLRMSVWSEEDEAAHKRMIIPDLVDETTLTFIYGDTLSLNDNSSQTVQYAFEHVGITDVALDAVWTAGYGQYVDSLKALANILATSAAAIFCRLQEHRDGVRRSINFSAAAFRGIYDKLLLLIKETIMTTPHLLQRWEKYIVHLLKRGCKIAGIDYSRYTISNLQS